MTPCAVIDACCLIDLLTTGRAEAILRAAGFDWRLPAAVEDEVSEVRQFDPARPGRIQKVSVDLSPLKTTGVLQGCAPANQIELDRFVHYATQFRADGEAMCIAIAEHRNWAIATDDRKAIRVAERAGLTVVSSPAIVKRWADAMQPDQATLCNVLRNIQVLAQFKPNPAMPEYQWWVDELATAPP